MLHDPDAAEPEQHSSPPLPPGRGGGRGGSRELEGAGEREGTAREQGIREMEREERRGGRDKWVPLVIGSRRCG